MEDVVSTKVTNPAFALIGFGTLTILGHLAIIVGDLAYLAYLFLDDELDLETIPANHSFLIASFLGLIAGYVIVKGGRRLFDQEKAGWVYAASLVAIIPCCSGLPFCCVGAPIGFWVLAVMQDEVVRSVFDDE